MEHGQSRGTKWRIAPFILAVALAAALGMRVAAAADARGTGKAKNQKVKKRYEYTFKGYDSHHLRKSVLKFDIEPDGTVRGIQIISSVNESNAHLAGGRISFSGHLTGSYPQVSGTFRGESMFGGKSTGRISGTFKMGYHPQFGVFMQLFGGSTGEEYYHRPARNPFN